MSSLPARAQQTTLGSPEGAETSEATTNSLQVRPSLQRWQRAVQGVWETTGTGEARPSKGDECPFDHGAATRGTGGARYRPQCCSSAGDGSAVGAGGGPP